MGLAVSVGNLAWCLKEGHDEDAELIREELAEVNRVLKANSRPKHVEPEALPPLRDRSEAAGVGQPYSYLHYLRRAVAFARQAPADFTPAPAGYDPDKDPRIDDELSLHMDSHLICHSDCEGYYVPQDFPEPLYDDGDDLPGGILGSSQQALAELVQVAPLIGIKLRAGKLSDAEAARVAADCRAGAHPYGVERYVWLRLFERFRLSVEYGAAVSFG